MKIKAIVLDLDGTLFTSNKTISTQTKDLLIKLQKQGIRLILASGRPTSGMLHLIQELELDTYHGILVSFNGACALDCGSLEPLFMKPLVQEKTTELLKHLKKFDLTVMVADDTYLYVHDVYDGMIDIKANNQPINIIEYEARGCNYMLCEVKDLAGFVDFPLYKVLIAGDPEYLQTIYNDMVKPFKKSLSYAFSAPFYFEFTELGIDKATTLQRVFESLNISKDNVIGFGDSHNDITMLKMVGKGVAMGNAEPEVLEIADEITLSNDEDGIVKSLSNYFPNLK